MPQARGVEDKHRFVKIITCHVLLDSTRYLPEEFKDGLRTLGVVDKIQEFSYQFTQCLCHVEEPLTAQIVDSILTAELCEPGSNQFATQQRAIVYWREFLQDCEGDFHFFSFFCAGGKGLGVRGVGYLMAMELNY